MTTAVHSQSLLPAVYDERGDTIAYRWPPGDSSYVPNELIVKFRHDRLDYDQLCFEYPQNEKSSGRELQGYLPQEHQTILRSQRFDLDSGIVKSSALASAMKSFGGASLRRMTLANPCVDTISIARDGDTLVCHDFDWMVLELDNDTSVVNASMWLTALFRSEIEFAEPNYYLEQHTAPTDPEFAQNQKNLQGGTGIGMESVWGSNGSKQVGRYDIMVAVIDDGIDYTHCEFGSATGNGEKVSKTWDANPNPGPLDFITGADHGTAIAGIIGAYTENRCAPTGPISGIAGIGGGWMSAMPARKGLQLLGLRIEGQPAQGFAGFTIADAAGAVRQAAAFSPVWSYGFGAHVVNCSWGVLSRAGAFDGGVSLSLSSAVNWAYEHGASIVASRGNMATIGSETPPTYPSCFNERWLVSVGGADPNKDRQHTGTVRSSFGQQMDLIAPAGNSVTQQLVRTTAPMGGYAWFDGTSAAAAHVSGVIGLLRSEAADRATSEPAGMWAKFKPEDFEGMLEVSALDRVTAPAPLEPAGSYYTGYDDRTGWGHLQADRAFQMLAEGYRIGHYSLTDNMTIGEPATGAARSFTSQGNPQYKTIPDGDYWAEPRAVSFIIPLNTDQWDREYPIYVWSHRSGRGGYSLESINNQTDWTEITNGSLNNSGNPLHDGIRLMPGPEGELIVEARTYQYDLYKLTAGNQKGSEFVGTYPPQEDLRANFSVFGIQGISHVAAEGSFSSPGARIYPQPADSRLAITVGSSLGPIDAVEIVDAHGRSRSRIASDGNISRDSRLDLDVSDLSAGIYLCVIRCGESRVIRPLIIVR